MKYFSMFSGIGGFEKGIQQAGIKAKCIGYSEIDKYAIKVYERQFNGHTNYGNATRINPTELPDFDLLVGGFPCQAFSIAGKRKGFDDTRGTLFFDVARVLAEKRPRHLVLENVKGLLSHDGGKTFQTILGVLSDLGYRVEWQVLNSKDFGVPQNRERIYFVGHLRGECSGEVFPITGNSPKTIEQGLVTVSAVTGVKDVNLSPTLDTMYKKGLGSKQARPAVKQLNKPTHSNDRVYSDEGISPTLNTMQGGNRQPFVMGKIDRQKQTFELKDTETAGTLTSTMWKGINASGRTGVKELPKIRRLTPLECERLQGFPETEVSAIIEVCIDHQKNSVNVVLKNLKSQRLVGSAAKTELVSDVSSAISSSQQKSQQTSGLVQPNVLIHLEGETVEIRNQKKSLLYASGATSQNLLALPMPKDAFVQTIAGILRIAEKITHFGKAELAPSDNNLTAQENGNSLEKIFGYEMELPAENVVNDLTILKESLKYTTSDHSDLESLGLNLAILSYYADHAMSGFTEKQTSSSNTSTYQISQTLGWTELAADGSSISDTQRYKMCGNAVTVNVVQAVMEKLSGC